MRNGFRDVDQEAVALWTKYLRDPELIQVRGSIVTSIPEIQLVGEHETRVARTAIGFCAIGAGILAMGYDPDEMTNMAAETYDFVDWLGGGAFWRRENAVTPVTVCIDWTPGLRSYDWEDCDYTQDSTVVAVIALNDVLGLPFPQIADLIDYFGLVLR